MITNFVKTKTVFDIKIWHSCC